MLKGNKHKKFSPEEDEKLMYLVKINGPRQWRKIAQSVEGRTGRQCRDRYRNYLAPTINKSKWTNEEDRLLVEKVKEYGSSWSKIAPFFAGRTSSSIKNRWYFKISPNYVNVLKDKKEKKLNEKIIPMDNHNDKEPLPVPINNNTIQPQQKDKKEIEIITQSNGEAKIDSVPDLFDVFNDTDIFW